MPESGQTTAPVVRATEETQVQPPSPESSKVLVPANTAGVETPVASHKSRSMVYAGGIALLVAIAAGGTWAFMRSGPAVPTAESPKNPARDSAPVAANDKAAPGAIGNPDTGEGQAGRDQAAYLSLAGAATFSYLLDQSRIDANPTGLQQTLESARKSSDPQVVEACKALEGYLEKLSQAGVLQDEANRKTADGSVAVVNEGVFGPTFRLAPTGDGGFEDATGLKLGEGLGNLFVGAAIEREASAARASADIERRSAWSSLYPIAKSLSIGPELIQANEVQVVVNSVPKEWNQDSASSAFGMLFAGSKATMPAILLKHSSDKAITWATLKITAYDASGASSESFHLIPGWPKGKVISPRLGQDWTEKQMARICRVKWELCPAGAKAVQGVSDFPKFIESQLQNVLDGGNFSDVIEEATAMNAKFADAPELRAVGDRLISDATAMSIRHRRLLSALEPGKQFHGDWTFGAYRKEVDFEILAPPRDTRPGKQVPRATLQYYEPGSPQLYAECELTLRFVDELKNYFIDSTQELTLLSNLTDKSPDLTQIMSRRGKDTKGWRFWAEREGQLVGTTYSGAIIRINLDGAPAGAPLDSTSSQAVLLKHTQPLDPILVEHLPPAKPVERWAIPHGNEELFRVSALPLTLGKGAMEDLVYSDGRVSLATFTPRGETILSAHNLGKVTGSPDLAIWDPETHDFVKGSKPVSAGGLVFAVAPDRSFAVRRTFNYDGPRAGYWVDFLDLKTGKEKADTTPFLLGAELGRVTVSKDGKLLMTANRDRLIVWDIQSGKEVHNIRHSKGIFHYVFSGDGESIICSLNDGALNFYDIATGKMKKSITVEQRRPNHSVVVADICTSPGWEGVLLRTVSTDGKGAQGGDARLELLSPQYELVQTIDLPRGVKQVKLSPTGRQILTIANNRIVGEEFLDNPIVVYDLPSGKPICRFVGHYNHITSTDFSDDGRFVLTGEGACWPWVVVWGVPEDPTLTYTDASPVTAKPAKPLADASKGAMPKDGDPKVVVEGKEPGKRLPADPMSPEQIQKKKLAEAKRTLSLAEARFKEGKFDEAKALAEKAYQGVGDDIAFRNKVEDLLDRIKSR
jgi:WD40 repeat protein